MTSHALKTTIVGLIILALAAFVLVQSGWSETGGPDSEVTFADVSDDVGFTYAATQEAQFGGGRTGVYVSDYTRDGYPDILAVGGDRPVLFRNMGGEYEPSDELTGIDTTVKSAIFLDHNNNGWEDLVLLPVDDSPIFLENNGGNFTEREIGLEEISLTAPTAAGAGDVTSNGCLDLVIVQNGDWRIDIPVKEIRTGPSDDGNGSTDEEWDDNGNQNYLLEGSCGAFEDISTEVGFTDTRWSNAVSVVDLTSNGHPDIHVANDFNYDYLYVNTGDGSLEPRQIPETNRHGMSSALADVTGSGEMDLFVTNIYFEETIWMETVFESLDKSGNSMLINDEGAFQSREQEFNVADGGWGWAAAFADFDNDGNIDLIHATQYYSPGSDRTNVIETPPRLWQGTTEEFQPVNATDRGFKATNGRGLAVLDYNNNGRMDVVIANLDGEFKLYQNEHTGGNWIQLRVAPDAEVPALGSKVTVTSEEGTWNHVVNANGDFLSQSTRINHVGVGESETVDVEVEWPDGTIRTFEDVMVNRCIELAHDGTLAEGGPGCDALPDLASTEGTD